MQDFRTTASLIDAVTSHPDPELRHLLAERIESLATFDGLELAEFMHVLVLEPGDCAADLEAHLGFALLRDRHTGAPFGSAAFCPPWEVIETHTNWFTSACNHTRVAG